MYTYRGSYHTLRMMMYWIGFTVLLSLRAYIFAPILLVVRVRIVLSCRVGFIVVPFFSVINTSYYAISLIDKAM